MKRSVERPIEFGTPQEIHRKKIVGEVRKKTNEKHIQTTMTQGDEVITITQVSIEATERTVIDHRSCSVSHSSATHESLVPHRQISSTFHKSSSPDKSMEADPRKLLGYGQGQGGTQES